MEEPPNESDSLLYNEAAPLQRNKRTATMAAKAIDEIDNLISTMGGMKISRHVFVEKKRIKLEDPDEMVVFVSPQFAVVHHTIRVELAIYFFEESDGVVLGDRIVLENSCGYNRDTLPMFTYSRDSPHFAACNENSRVQIWEIVSGAVIELVATDHSDPENPLCVSHPSAFAISGAYVVVGHPTTPTTSTLYVHRWTASPMLGPLGRVDETWHAVPSGMYASIEVVYLY
jgi:hypothetical protein